ncbi:MAG: 4Fe-4S dicluster domain-containing protein [Chloroflexota bacterium]
MTMPANTRWCAASWPSGPSPRKGRDFPARSCAACPSASATWPACWFAGCSLCGDCLDACPLYDGELSGLLGMGSARYGGRPLLAELVDVSRWLASCSGCGMCEEACSCGVPITLLIAPLADRMRQELHYTPGDPAQRLPRAMG